MRKAAATLLACVFTLTSVPALGAAQVLVPYSASQRRDVRQAMLRLAARKIPGSPAAVFGVVYDPARRYDKRTLGEIRAEIEELTGRKLAVSLLERDTRRLASAGLVRLEGKGESATVEATLSDVSDGVIDELYEALRGMKNKTIPRIDQIQEVVRAVAESRGGRVTETIAYRRSTALIIEFPSGVDPAPMGEAGLLPRTRAQHEERQQKLKEQIEKIADVLSVNGDVSPEQNPLSDKELGDGRVHFSGGGEGKFPFHPGSGGVGEPVRREEIRRILDEHPELAASAEALWEHLKETGQAEELFEGENFDSPEAILDCLDDLISTHAAPTVENENYRSPTSIMPRPPRDRGGEPAALSPDRVINTLRFNKMQILDDRLVWGSFFEDLNLETPPEKFDPDYDDIRKKTGIIIKFPELPHTRIELLREIMWNFRQNLIHFIFIHERDSALDVSIELQRIERGTKRGIRIISRSEGPTVDFDSILSGEKYRPRMIDEFSGDVIGDKVRGVFLMMLAGIAKNTEGIELAFERAGQNNIISVTVFEQANPCANGDVSPEQNPLSDNKLGDGSVHFGRRRFLAKKTDDSSPASESVSAEETLILEWALPAEKNREEERRLSRHFTNALVKKLDQIGWSGAYESIRIPAREMARNIIMHGKGGYVRVYCVENPDGSRGLKITGKDEGPGMDNPNELLQKSIAVQRQYRAGNRLEEGYGLSHIAMYPAGVTVKTKKADRPKADEWVKVGGRLPIPNYLSDIEDLEQKIALEHVGACELEKGNEITLAWPEEVSGADEIEEGYRPLCGYLSEHGNSPEAIRKFIDITKRYKRLLIEIGCGSTNIAYRIAKKNQDLGVFATDIYFRRGRYSHYAEAFEKGNLPPQDPELKLGNLEVVRAGVDIINVLPHDLKMDYILLVSPEVALSRRLAECDPGKALKRGGSIVIKPFYGTTERSELILTARSNLTCNTRTNERHFLGVDLYAESDFAADEELLVLGRRELHFLTRPTQIEEIIRDYGRTGQSLILYADEILENTVVMDLEETIRKLRPLIKGGKILLFAEEEGNAILLESQIKRTDSTLDVVTMTRNELKRLKPERITDVRPEEEAGELLRVARARFGIEKEKVLAVVKGTTPDFELFTEALSFSEEGTKKYIPLVFLGLREEKGAYLLLPGIARALKREERFIPLYPVRPFSREMRKQYLRSLEAARRGA